MDSGLRILEIGEFCLFKRCVPNQTTFLFTGANARDLAGISFRPFSPRVVPGLLASLRRADWDLVFCYPPSMPLLDCRRGAMGALSALARLLFRFQTFGTYIARQSRSPLVVLDFNDTPTISPLGLALLDRSMAYFKRELPLDPAKALFNAVPRFRTHRRVMSSKFFDRNRTKFLPISAGVPGSTADLALALNPKKTVDVFFAGSANSEIRRKGLMQLAALSEKGFVIDASNGGLSKREYLERCARSWLTWSPEGFGWECWRHYEASLCLSVPILSPPAITRYAPLLDGIHAFFYSVESDSLINTIERALSQKRLLEQMAVNARQHVLSHHVHGRICEHIVASTMGIVAELSANISSGHDAT